MQITLIKGEPIGAAIARMAADNAEGAGRAVRRLLVGSNTGYLGFSLPTHLDALARAIPAQIGATAAFLAQNFTFYPALTPLLDREEQSALLKAMSVGRRLPALPICSSNERGATKSGIRFCPQCAREDRHGRFGVAVCRMVHIRRFCVFKA